MNQNSNQPEANEKDDGLTGVIADYVAGEMPPAERAAFEQRMRNDTALKARVDSLTGVHRTLDRVLWAPPESQEKQEPVAGRLGWSMARYAAVLIAGVLIGWSVRPAPIVTPEVESVTSTGPSPYVQATRSSAEMSPWPAITLSEAQLSELAQIKVDPRLIQGLAATVVRSEDRAGFMHR